MLTNSEFGSEFKEAWCCMALEHQAPTKKQRIFVENIAGSFGNDAIRETKITSKVDGIALGLGVLRLRPNGDGQ